jgi:hypothetical protein
MMPGLSSSAPPAVLSSRSLRPAIPSADLRRRPLAISVTPGSRMSPDIHLLPHSLLGRRRRRQRAVMRGNGLSLVRAGLCRR